MSLVLVSIVSGEVIEKAVVRRPSRIGRSTCRMMVRVSPATRFVTRQSRSSFTVASVGQVIPASAENTLTDVAWFTLPPLKLTVVFIQLPRLNVRTSTVLAVSLPAALLTVRRMKCDPVASGTVTAGEKPPELLRLTSATSAKLASSVVAREVRDRQLLPVLGSATLSPETSTQALFVISTSAPDPAWVTICSVLRASTAIEPLSVVVQVTRVT